MKSYNRALFKEHLKRFWVIAALPLLAYLLFVLLPLHNQNRSTDAYYTVRLLVDTFRMSHPLLVFTSVAVPLMTALSLYSYLFNPRAATAISAYPVNRRQLFFTNFFAGLALMVVPLLILGALLLIPVTAAGGFEGERVVLENWQYAMPSAIFPRQLVPGDVINTFPIVMAFMGRMLITYIFYFALFALASVLAGHGIVAFLLCAALPFIPTGAVLLDQTVKYWMVAGYTLAGLGDIVGSVLMYTNPVAWFWSFESGAVNYAPVFIRVFALFSGGEATAAVPQLLLASTYTVITAALIAAGYWLNKIRKQERTGDSVVFNPFKQVLIFLLSLAGGIIMVVFFLNMLNTRMLAAAMYGGFALGFVLAFFIAQMIAEKTFNVGRKFKALIKFAAVMAGVYLVIFVSIRFDLNGFQRYVPSAGSVSGVYVMDYYNPNSIGKISPYTQWAEADWVTDREIVERTVAAHQTTVADLPELRTTIGYQLTGWSMGEDIRRQYVFYQLTNGEVVARTYYLTPGMSDRYGWTDLRKDERNILSDYQVLLRPGEAVSVRLYHSQYEGGEDGGSFKERNLPPVTQPEEIAALFAEMKKDVINIACETQEKGYTDYASYISATIEIDVPIPQTPRVTAGVSVFRPSPLKTYGLHLSLYDNTLKWLRENGYTK